MLAFAFHGAREGSRSFQAGHADLVEASIAAPRGGPDDFKLQGRPPSFT
jgi:hypothetical protein